MIDENRPHGDTSMAVVRASRYDFSTTLERLSAAIAAAGARIFAQIDQRAAAQGVGLELRPTTLIVFGNPNGGTPLMDAFPLFALELPLKLLVWEADATVSVAYERVAPSAARFGIDRDDARLAGLDAALEKVASAIA